MNKKHFHATLDGKIIILTNHLLKYLQSFVWQFNLKRAKYPLRKNNCEINP